MTILFSLLTIAGLIASALHDFRQTRTGGHSFVSNN